MSKDAKRSIAIEIVAGESSRGRAKEVEGYPTMKNPPYVREVHAAR